MSTSEATAAPLTSHAHPALPIEWATFSGTTGEDVHLFIQAVNRAALLQGRYADDNWMYLYAQSCLIGPAFTWFLEWSRLQRSYYKQPTDWLDLMSALASEYKSSVGAPSPPRAAPAAASIPGSEPSSCFCLSPCLMPAHDTCRG